MSSSDHRLPFDVTEPDMDAPDGASLELEDGWYVRSGDRWYPVAAETGRRAQAEAVAFELEPPARREKGGTSGGKRA